MVYWYHIKPEGMIPINPQIKGSLYLIACAFVWGMAFVAQGSAMDYVEPATFVAVRPRCSHASPGEGPGASPR